MFIFPTVVVVTARVAVARIRARLGKSGGNALVAIGKQRCVASFLLVNQLLKLGRGAVVELGQNVGDPIDLRINNRLVGRGEVVVVEDRLAISITEMIQNK